MRAVDFWLKNFGSFMSFEMWKRSNYPLTFFLTLLLNLELLIPT